MKFTLNVDDANALIKYAKAYVLPNNPRELYRMIKVEIEKQSITATMLTNASVIICHFRTMEDNSENGTMFIRPPLTKFKRKDMFVTVEDSEKETVYITASGKVTLQKEDTVYSWLSTEHFFTKDAISTIYVDGNLLSRSIGCMGNTVKVEFLGDTNGLRLTSREGKAIVLPISPKKAEKEFEYYGMA